MADDPRKYPIENLPVNDNLGLGRLTLPVGLDGMRLEAAQAALEFGGDQYNISGQADQTLGEIAAAINKVGGILSALNGFAKSADSYITSQNLQRLQNELESKVNTFQDSYSKFNTTQYSFMSSGANLSAMQYTANAYLNEINSLSASITANNTALNDLSIKANSLMAQFRATRDSATRSAISTELKSIQSQVLGIQGQNQYLTGQAGALSSAMSSLQTDMTAAQAETNMFKQQTLDSHGEMLKNFGEVNQAKESLVNDYNNFMTRAEAFGLSDMSTSAMSTFSNGLADFAMGNYAKSGAEFGAMAFDFTQLFAPSLVPAAGLIKAGMIGIGAGVDAQNAAIGGLQFLNTMGIGAGIEGSMRSFDALQKSINNSDGIGAMQSSWGLVSNSLDVMGRSSATAMGLVGEPVISTGVGLATNLFSDLAAWSGAMTGNILSSGDVSPLVAANVEVMNFASMLDVTNGNMVVNGLGSFLSSFDNLVNGKLGDPSNQTWQQKWENSLQQMQYDYNQGSLQFNGVKAYEQGLQNMWNVQSIPWRSSLGLPTTSAFDGPNAGFNSFPWSQAPNQPFDPSTISQSFVPDYSKMQPWDPKDPFNLDPKKQAPSEPSKAPKPPKPCPKPKPPPFPPPTPPAPSPPKPPESSGRGTGSLPPPTYS